MFSGLPTVATHETGHCAIKGRNVMEKIRIEQHSVGGLLWAFGWLFTVGFLEMTFWRGVLAFLLWPYYLGVMVSSLLEKAGP